jgi:flagellar hook-basal body complex protein FliE
MRIDGIRPGTGIEKPEFPKRITSDKQSLSFKDTLATFLGDVNNSQKTASDAQVKFLTGEVTDVHQVVNKSEEAKLGFNMLMELRNKSLDGYKEIMQIRL